MENELKVISKEEIQDLIYTVRGKQVMLDSDVARLYHSETKKINQAVKRNIERFPEDFCFQLDENEVENLRSQIVTSSLEKENFKQKIFFEGQIYDAYILIIDIIKKANKKIFII